MWLYDTNVLIYSARPADQPLRDLLTARGGYLSLVSKVEALGFRRLSSEDKDYFQQRFLTLRVLPVSDAVADIAIQLRQIRRIALGDALIAATAIEYALTLVTNNERDFMGLPGLALENPFAPGGGLAAP